MLPALFTSPIEINPAELAQAAFVASTEEDIQELIVKARDYHAGDSFDSELQTKLKQFVIGGDVEDITGLNIARKVVNAVLRRLSVQGFDVTGVDEEDQQGKVEAEDQTARMWQIWKDNRMDTRQRRVHRQALVDGESFIVVAYDNEAETVSLIPHQRYTDPTVGGDGYGCKAHYPNDDISQPMEYASKRWTETYYENGKKKTRRRMTLYYPHAVFKYTHNGVDWERYDEEDNGIWPIWWTDNHTQSGEPLGIPVIHFVNPEERPEAKDAFGPQVATDQALVDLLGAGALSAFRIYKAFGFYPTTDGQEPKDDDSNRLKLQPGVIVGTTKKSKSEAEFDAIESGDLSQLMNLINELFVWTAIVTETPISEFTATRQLAAEGTLKQQETALVARVEERQDVFGDAWEDVMGMARQLDKVFGDSGHNEELSIETTWKPAQTRSQEETTAEIQAKAETGVPWRQLMIEWGYSPDKIAEMEEMPDRQAVASAMELLTANGQNG